jgi:hypothetical protein
MKLTKKQRNIFPSDEEIQREIGKRYYMKDSPHDLEQGFEDAIDWIRKLLNINNS